MIFFYKKIKYFCYLLNIRNINHIQNNKVIYEANAFQPLFIIIQNIVHKHLVIEEISEIIYNRIVEVKKSYFSIKNMSLKQNSLIIFEA
tara:strand:+ start:77 stop:343 length:267 start_codon:yes stop_codon:yes gene_type:complete